MTTTQTEMISVTRGRSRRKLTSLVAVVLLALLLPASAMAEDINWVRSILLPGSGQADRGNFRRASVFAGATVFFAAGSIVTQVHYNQAVDRFRSANSEYESYPGRLAGGEIIFGSTIDGTWNDLNSAFADADDREVWRNFMVTGLIVTYAVNLVDLLVSKPHDPDLARGFDIEATPETIMLTKTIRF